MANKAFIVGTGRVWILVCEERVGGGENCRFWQPAWDSCSRRTVSSLLRNYIALM